MNDEQKRKRRQLIIGILALIGFGIVAIWATIWLNDVANGSSSSGGAVRVVYTVTGTTKTASLTYRNESGGTEQRTVDLPWELSYMAESGHFTYVAAQVRDNGSRNIVCKITHDGVTKEEAESDGEFVIAECSGSVE